ncbi:hypothetical protein [Novibacillus thermophilus]|uniref:FAD/FMN-containing dehydrogenase n=1 Tax=Novibacillus thermophilus TaxID=1471761 RepID=A0A1U9K6S1_9BACL|nr:hypothetical protein [Novibacillus thermophilus]AQS55728.1 hypothetical protein B0W44_07905 [Novibacillus thermophilus]
MKKKTALLMSFALAIVLVVGQIAFAHGEDDNGGMGIMDGNGISGMMNNANMGQMMEAMNSPEGQEMMNACMNFMQSQNNDTSS